MYGRVLLLCLGLTLMGVGCGERQPPDPDLERWQHTMTGQLIAQAEPVIAGKVLFHRHGCIQCHTVDGTRRIGPSLTEVYGRERELTDGRIVMGDEDYIRRSILYSRQEIVKGYRGEMPMYERIISEPEVRVLIAYIKSISSKPESDEP